MGTALSMFFLWTGSADAQGQPAPGKTDPTIHMHDGFYLRLALGPGYLKGSGAQAGTPVFNQGSDATIHGAGLAGELMLGGTPAPGLAIGGGSVGMTAFGPEYKTGSGQSAAFHGMVNLSMLGVFADWYFNPRKGLHLQALAGLAMMSFEADRGPSATNKPAGMGFGLGFGHEWWIGEQWGIGVLGRVLVARVSDDDEKHKVMVPGALCTLTYH